MNRNSSIALSGIVIAVAVGVLGLNGVFSMSSENSVNTLSGGEKLLGHLEVVDKDPSGIVKAYRQTDNIVTNIGRTCTATAVFGNTLAANPQCNNIGAFKYIAIGSGSSSAATTDSSLQSQITALVNTGYTVTNSTNSPTVGGIAQQSVTYNFVSSQTVQESGLLDGTQSGTANHLYARQTFTAIPVNSGDSLTITWKITTG